MAIENREEAIESLAKVNYSRLELEAERDTLQQEIAELQRILESNARFSDDLCCIAFNRHYTYNKTDNKPTTSTATKSASRER